MTHQASQLHSCLPLCLELTVKNLYPCLVQGSQQDERKQAPCLCHSCLLALGRQAVRLSYSGVHLCLHTILRLTSLLLWQLKVYKVQKDWQMDLPKANAAGCAAVPNAAVQPCSLTFRSAYPQIASRGAAIWRRTSNLHREEAVCLTCIPSYLDAMKAAERSSDPSHAHIRYLLIKIVLLSYTKPW